MKNRIQLIPNIIKLFHAKSIIVNSQNLEVSLEPCNNSRQRDTKAPPRHSLFGLILTKIVQFRTNSNNYTTRGRIGKILRISTDRRNNFSTRQPPAEACYNCSPMPMHFLKAKNMPIMRQFPNSISHIKIFMRSVNHNTPSSTYIYI